MQFVGDYSAARCATALRESWRAAVGQASRTRARRGGGARRRGAVAQTAAPATPRHAPLAAGHIRRRRRARHHHVRSSCRAEPASAQKTPHHHAETAQAWDDALYAKRKPEIISEVDGKFCCLVEWVEQPLPPTEKALTQRGK